MQVLFWWSFFQLLHVKVQGVPFFTAGCPESIFWGCGSGKSCQEQIFLQRTANCMKHGQRQASSWRTFRALLLFNPGIPGLQALNNNKPQTIGILESQTAFNTSYMHLDRGLSPPSFTHNLRSLRKLQDKHV